MEDIKKIGRYVLIIGLSLGQAHYNKTTKDKNNREPEIILRHQELLISLGKGYIDESGTFQRKPVERVCFIEYLEEHNPDRLKEINPKYLRLVRNSIENK